jgi:hypothetical protein
MTVHLFGIRHHGPGSARSLRQALPQFQPDILLVEGPPDADSLLPLLIHPEMEPPVALLLYRPDDPWRAAYYPFAIFSPEWQALHYALTAQIPARFMDLPQAHRLALPAEEMAEAATGEIRQDPLGWVAQAAGYSDGERWWEHIVEQRRDSVELFTAIQELMTALRAEFPEEAGPLEARREAYMRQTIRAAQQAGYQRIAVVCGAWHVPALVDLSQAAIDSKRLRGLAKTKVTATWVPWNYERLALWSGYGAGIESPGWYHHLWSQADEVAIHWLSRVAALFRAEDLETSPAHIIEAARLAETLAALRDRPLPGLPELLEAIEAVFCSGHTAPLALIRQKLLVSDRLGRIPPETPLLPIQQDLLRLQQRLRLELQAGLQTIDLDLRKPMHLERSHLLHRLTLLGLPWGKPEPVRGKSGTFHEIWRLQWQPEFAVIMVELNLWGNTVLEAATNYSRNQTQEATELPTLTRLVQQVLLADLPEAVQALIARLQALAAVTSDMSHLMRALPPLADVLRYGNVRQTDTQSVARLVDGLVVRICAGLPLACQSLNDEAAQEMVRQIGAVDQALALLQNEEHQARWFETLQKLAGQPQLHGLLGGRCCRLLFERGVWPLPEVERQLGLACSPAGGPAYSAAWLAGFLSGSGLLLLHHEALWQILDAWLVGLPAETFNQLLPLLRRTFATFPRPERRQMGEKVAQGAPLARTRLAAHEIDAERARHILPLAAQLLGLNFSQEGEQP